MKSSGNTNKCVIIFDSLYGNTEFIARAIARGIQPAGNIKTTSVIEAQLGDLAALDILIVGSPTQGGRPKGDLQEFLNTIPQHALNGISVAAFDTRFAEEEQNFPLRLLMRTIGYAAPKIANILQKKGGTLLTPPEGFIVTGTEGPLKNGELERATEWGKTLFTLKKKR